MHAHAVLLLALASCMFPPALAGRALKQFPGLAGGLLGNLAPSHPASTTAQPTSSNGNPALQPSSINQQNSISQQGATPWSSGGSSPLALQVPTSPAATSNSQGVVPASPELPTSLTSSTWGGLTTSLTAPAASHASVSPSMAIPSFSTRPGSSSPSLAPPASPSVSWPANPSLSPKASPSPSPASFSLAVPSPSPKAAPFSPATPSPSPKASPSTSPLPVSPAVPSPSPKTAPFSPATPSPSPEASPSPSPAPSPAANGTSAGGGCPDGMAVLDRHNTLRAAHGAPPLAWSSSLAATALAWSNGCNFKHSGNGYGENLAWGYATCVEAVNAWYAERSSYTGSFSEASGHFSQVVWKGSTQLGCGYAPACKMLTCNYSPPGNVAGQFASNVQP